MPTLDRCFRWLRAHRRVIGWVLLVGAVVLEGWVDSLWVSVPVAVVLVAFFGGVVAVPWCRLVVSSYRAGLRGESKA